MSTNKTAKAFAYCSLKGRPKPSCRDFSEASTWKYQRGNQSGTSFPAKTGIRCYPRQFPQVERESDQSTRKKYTNMKVKLMIII